MRSPVSTRVVFGGVEDALEGVVLGGVVGGVVLPAVPDDEQPGAGEDADGVGVVVASGSGAVVEVGGPGVGVAGVSGEVGDGVAELFVAGPAESDRAEFAGLSGRGCGACQAGEGFGGGEAGAAVADLGQQPGGADSACAGQAGEDVGVGVRGELVCDLAGQGFDLVGQGGEYGDQRVGDLGVEVAVVAGGAARCRDQVGMQPGGIGAAGVADAGQPG